MVYGSRTASNIPYEVVHSGAQIYTLTANVCCCITRPAPAMALLSSPPAGPTPGGIGASIKTKTKGYRPCPAPALSVIKEWGPSK